MRAALLFVLLASSPALAAEDKVAASTETSAAGDTQAQPQEEKKICRRVEASESRTAAKRVCLTLSEWKKKSQQEFEGY
jgi:hypothetical protein